MYHERETVRVQERLRMVMAALALVSLLFACSDDEGEATDGTVNEESDPDDEEPDPDDPRTESERAADEAAAQEAVLTLADFPPGWESTPAEDEEEDSDELEAELAECLGVDVSEFNQNNPRSDSPTFVSERDEQVESRVAVTSSVEDASENMTLLRDEAVPSCYADALESVIAERLRDPESGQEPPDDLEVGEPSFNQLSIAPVGDEVVAYRATIPLSADGFNVDVFLDFVTARVGRVGVTMTFQSQFSPFSSEEAEGLMNTVIDRIPPDL